MQLFNWAQDEDLPQLSPSFSIQFFVHLHTHCYTQSFILVKCSFNKCYWKQANSISVKVYYFFRWIHNRLDISLRNGYIGKFVMHQILRILDNMGIIEFYYIYYTIFLNSQFHSKTDMK